MSTLSHVLCLVLFLLMSCQVPIQTVPPAKPSTSEASAPSTSEWRDPLTERRYKSTVRILVDCGEPNGSAGSGVAISPTEILTAKHVVCDEKNPVSVHVILWNGVSIPASLVHKAKEDVARLEIVMKLQHWMPIGSTKPKIGDRLCYMGGAYEHVPTKCGEVYKYDDKGHVWANIHIVPGNSGGALYNDQWEVVGIMAWRPSHPKEHSKRELVGGGVLAGHFPLKKAQDQRKEWTEGPDCAEVDR